MADEIFSKGKGRLLPQKWKDLGDGSWALVVATTDGGSGGGGVDRELSVVMYQVKTAFTGAVVGDMVSATRVYDVSSSAVTQVGDTVWRNESQNTVLATPPNVANLGPMSTGGGITNAEMTVLMNAQNTILNGLATQATLAAMSAKLPATLGTKASAAALAVVIASDDAQIGTKVTAVTALPAGGAGLIGWLSNIWSILASVLPVNVLRSPLVARKIQLTAMSAQVALTAGVKRISIYARGCDGRFKITATIGIADAALDNFIAAGERLEFGDLTGTPWLQAIAADLQSATGQLEITELS